MTATRDPVTGKGTRPDGTVAGGPVPDGRVAEGILPNSIDPAGVGDLLSTLIRFDTSNPGGSERLAAEWVAARLDDAGVGCTLFESERGRTSLVARITGTDPGRPALLVHGHLDVVPADGADWTVPPFSGEIRDGCVWGRGAVDMKDMLAMLLTVFSDWHRRGYQPPRDIVLAFTADEEAGGRLGAGFLVDRHADLLADCSEAIGEVGGFSVTMAGGQRIYPIQTAERGAAWLRLSVRGTSGHGSLMNDDNAVTRLSTVMSRLGNHRFPIYLTAETRILLATVSRLSDPSDLSDPSHPADPSEPTDPERGLHALGGFGRMLRSTLRNTVTPTGFHAGDKVNTVPGGAEATVDARFLPGRREELFAVLDDLIGPDVSREFLLEHDAVTTTCEGPTFEAMAAALVAVDPAGHPVPYLLSGGTDAKSFSRLGIRCFGFSPLRLPAGQDFVALFHGIDERVPLEALGFGVRVLDRFLRTC